MTPSRRDFLRTTACALGGLALASTVDSFQAVSALTPQAAPDYRALVCVFMNGGNDGNNMVVSLDQYAAYSAARAAAGLAIPQTSLLPVSPAGGGSYGFHPSMAEMQSLFNQGRLAVLCNTGPLVEPLTRATYQSGAGKRPLQLFSHSDQVALFQTAVADSVSQTGWGGRVADRTAGLNGAATFPQNVSIAGINLFLTGGNTRQLAIADSNTSLANVLPLTMTGSAAEVNSRLASFNELRTLDNGHKLVKAASDTRSSAMQTRAALASVGSPTFAAAFPNTTLGRQLQQIARLIALRDTLGVKRQIFFAQLGGFDTHSGQRAVVNNQPGGQDGLLLQVSQAMNAFYAATVEMGIHNNVTTFTLSDFSRTLNPAGSGQNQVGSDHAWGNHHLILGGAVRGGSFYGTYPTLAAGGPDDTDGGSAPRGRWIPTTSVEQYAATLAGWYGLAQSDFPAVFPLLDRFPTANMGFMS